MSSNPFISPLPSPSQAYSFLGESASHKRRRAVAPFSFLDSSWSHSAVGVRVGYQLNIKKCNICDILILQCYLFTQ